MASAWVCSSLAVAIPSGLPDLLVGHAGDLGLFVGLRHSGGVVLTVCF